jgi:hypothetical protein
MRQSTTAPPPRSWSKTEGYDREQRDFSSTNAESSSHTVQNQNSTNGPLLRRSASVGSNDDQDNAPVGIDTRQPREPLSLPQSIDFVWQNLNMTEQDLSTFATKYVLLIFHIIGWQILTDNVPAGQQISTFALHAGYRDIGKE